MTKKEKIRFILIILAILIIVGLKIVAVFWEKQQKHEPLLQFLA